MELGSSWRLVGTFRMYSLRSIGAAGRDSDTLTIVTSV